MKAGPKGTVTAPPLDLRGADGAQVDQRGVQPEDAAEEHEIGLEGELVGALEADAVDQPHEVAGEVAEGDRLGAVVFVSFRYFSPGRELHP